MLDSIFVALQDIIGGFGNTIVDIFMDITRIFFITTGEGSFELTPVGTLSLMAFGIGLIWTGIRWLSRLIKMRG